MLRGGACDANLLVHDGDNDSEHDLSSHHQHQEQRVLQPAHTHASPSTAHLHIIHTMSSRVYETVRCPSVCLSRSHAPAACGAGLRYRSIAARPAPQQHGARQQMRAVPRFRRTRIDASGQLPDEERARDSDVLVCNFAKYSPIVIFFTDKITCNIPIEKGLVRCKSLS